ncbi:MAG: hypothetical protein RLZ10_1343, partial [Bacteroidota bacterium]
MQKITTLKRTDFETSNQPNSIDLLIDKKEYDIHTEDCLCIINEVEFVKIIDLTTQTPLPVIETTQATATLLPRKGFSKFFSRVCNRLTVLPLTMPLCLVMMLGLFSGNGRGQFTGTYNFASVTTTSGTTDPTSVPTATGVTFGSFSSSIGTNSGAAGRFSFTGWPTGATNNSNTFTGSINTSSYYQVSITVATGYTVSLSSINFTLQRSGTGIRQYAVRTSADSYSANLSASISPSNVDLSVVATNIFQVVDATTAAETGSKITLSGANFTNLAAGTTRTFRFYGWNAEASGGTFSIDDVIISGTATAAASVPTAPSITSITPGNQQLSVDFTVGSDGGSAITNYKYSTNGGTNWQTRSTGTTASPLVISTLSTDGTTALTNGTSYNVQIRAVNAVGDGTATASTAATPRTTPSAPTITSITPGNQQLSVVFTAGSDGGSAITTYKYSTDGGINWQTRATGTTASPLLISTLSTDGTTALTNGVSYDIQIRAVNAAGDGTATGTTQGTPAAPVLPTLNPVTLASALTTTYGTASAGVSFAVGGSNLTTTITVTPQSGYEIATSSGGTYQSTAMTGISNGTTLWVRFASTYSAGSYNSATAVVLSGGGASSSANVTTSSSGNTVAQKALTVTGLTAQNKVYDGLTTATTIGTAALSGIVGADVVSLTGTPTYTFASANVGTGISVSTTGYSLTGAQ